MKKVLLIILGVIVGVIVILMIVTAFTKKEQTITREITINKPNREVFDFVDMSRTNPDSPDHRSN